MAQARGYALRVGRPSTHFASGRSMGGVMVPTGRAAIRPTNPVQRSRRKNLMSAMRQNRTF